MPGAQQLPWSPDRGTVVVQLLGIGAQPGTGVVIQDRAVVPAQRSCQVAGRGIAILGEAGPHRSIEGLHDLWASVRIDGSGPAQSSLGPPQGAVVTLHELDLDLLEAPKRPPIVDHLNRVQHHRGDVDAGVLHHHPGASCPHRGDGDQRTSARMRQHQSAHIVGDIWAVELRPTRALGDLLHVAARAAIRRDRSPPTPSP